MGRILTAFPLYLVKTCGARRGAAAHLIVYGSGLVPNLVRSATEGGRNGSFPSSAQHAVTPSLALLRLFEPSVATLPSEGEGEEECIPLSVLPSPSEGKASGA